MRKRLPLLTAVAEGVTGGPQIQNQGTIGGAACAGKPASDIPGALLALEALAVVQGPGGRRTVPATDLWLEPFRSALAADELLIGFDVAVRGGGSRDGFAYRKLKFGTSSWPIVTVGAVASLDEAGVLARLTVGIGAAAAVPFQVPAQDLVGSAPTNDLAEEIAVRAKDALTDPWSDELAPAAYRTAVLPAVVRSVVAAALTRAAGSQEARSCPR
ncbi:FAD binding domain-containing protein [Streptomyces viridochromogenes]|uniref:Putative Molybdopterin dehydrogenase, FAD-binding protein n=1 Tax=Streptomyces viridochromogenes Tue57 TaxID=1160705 RepID=L8P6Y7_STRVR|nr:FAD binding domain-containing protein [Streptomyces viridochromogenes]ELS51057.1 putative Molybdopterin dehydrogenase, FAD-binding protein [Streptomyces viridochromogenes Tue57]